MTKIRSMMAAALVAGLVAIPMTAGAAPESSMNDPMNPGMRSSMQSSAADKLMVGWGATPKKVAMEMIAKYGQPHEATASMLVWHNNGPWKRTVVYREERNHAFPIAHTDLVEQFIDYKVPPAKHTEIAVFDGSVNIDRTGGELSARCDKEAANMLALNLADEIVTGKRNVAQARAHYAASIQAMMAKKPNEYTQRLLFASQGGGGGMGMSRTADPGVPFIK